MVRGAGRVQVGPLLTWLLSPVGLGGQDGQGQKREGEETPLPPTLD